MKVNIRTCRPVCVGDEISVDSSLAITPADMQDLTSQGRAVSLASLENQSYFTNEIDVKDMPMEYVRGVDMNVLWEASKVSSKKIKAFQKSNKNTTVDGEQKGGA